MADETKKIIQRVKKIDKQYFKLNPEEQYKRIAEMLKDLSPNEKVRNRKK